MRIVVDTNIWVSGLLWQGKPWQVLKLAETGDIELCVAYAMLLELEEVLSYKRLQSRMQMLEQTPFQLAAYALSISTVYDISVRGLPIVADDPDDDIFVVCAIEAGADYLVTGDKHLLDLGSYQSVKIVTVAEFLEQIF